MQWLAGGCMKNRYLTPWRLIESSVSCYIYMSSRITREARYVLLAQSATERKRENCPCSSPSSFSCPNDPQVLTGQLGYVIPHAFCICLVVSSQLYMSRGRDQAATLTNAWKSLICFFESTVVNMLSTFSLSFAFSLAYSKHLNNIRTYRGKKRYICVRCF